MQVDTLRGALFQRIGIVFFHEKFRSCETEPVNTLLYIPDHENIIFPTLLSGNGAKQCLLHFVAVLILVDHDLLKGIPELFRSLFRLLRLLIHKDLQCKMFHIMEIHQIFPAFCGCKLICKLLCEDGQPPLTSAPCALTARSSSPANRKNIVCRVFSPHPLPAP